MAMRKYYGDVSSYPHDFHVSLFHISSGFTVDTSRYLHSLWRFCIHCKASLVRKKIISLSELNSFNHIVLAMGADI